MSLVQRLADMTNGNRIEQDKDSAQTITRSYIAAEDSAGGTVRVYFDGEVVSDTDQSVVVEVPVVGAVKQGDIVYVTAYGVGAAKQLIAYGGVGAGDRQQADIDHAIEGVDTAWDAIDNTFLYDVTYELVGTNYVFTAHLYRAGEEVTDEYPPDVFGWILRTETGDIPQPADYTYTVAQADAGYRASVIGGFINFTTSTLVTSGGLNFVTSDGDTLVAYTYLEV